MEEEHSISSEEVVAQVLAELLFDEGMKKVELFGKREDRIRSEWLEGRSWDNKWADPEPFNNIRPKTLLKHKWVLQI